MNTHTKLLYTEDYKLLILIYILKSVEYLSASITGDNYLHKLLTEISLELAKFTIP
jgi:hypothetical protein